MNNYLFIVVLGCLSWLLPNHANACGYNFVSSCNTILNVEANGTNTGYYAASCGYLSSFDNKNFGDVTSILLTYAETVTWESCENRVLSGQLYYRIYETGTTPGSFQLYNLPTLTLLSNGTYRTKKRSNSTALDLASGLNQGNYTFEIYFETAVDFNNDNIADGTMVRDNNGSYYKSFFNLTNGGTGALSVNFPTKNNASCSGTSNGSATAAASNGSAPYTFAWSNGQATATATNLAAGTYSVTITDATSATGTANVAITQPSAVIPNASATDTNSNTAMNGTATASPFGGTPPYNYTWSNNQTTQTISELNSGSYTVTVTDTNGCTGTQSVFVSVNSGVPITYCAAQSGFPWTDWISNVTFNQINKNSNKNVYNDFTSNVTDAATSSSYDFSATSSFSWNTYDEYFRVWIDYNRDGLFQEPAEIAFSKILPAPATFGTSETVTGSISIPSNAELGGTRMRVIMTRGAYASPCGNIDYGEIEDYTINIVQGGPPVCSILATTTTSICNNQSTPTMPSDDTFTFDLAVTGTNTGSGWTATIDGQSVSGTYGTSETFGPFLISGGDLNFTVTDDLDNACTDGVSISPPASCSNEVCSISASPIVSDCDNAGTDTDPSDDTFTFDLTVTGTNTGSGWTATIDGQSVSGTYGTSETFGPFLISGGDLNFTVTDDLDNACTDGVSISPPASCSNEVCSISASPIVSDCDNAGTDTDPSDDTFTFDLTVTGTNTGSGWTATIDGQSASGTYGTSETFGPFLISGGDLNFTVTDDLDNACTDGVSISPPASCSNEVCSISASPIVSDCDNAGTDTDPSDDTFTFDLTVTGTNTGSGWTATIDGQSVSGTYGTSETFGPFLISGGDLNFTVTDDLDNACTDGVSISPPASCSNEVCSISASPIVSDCDNAGTDTDPSDDTFTFDLTVTGTNTGSGWTATIDGQSVSGTYGTSETFGPFLISGGDLNFTVTDDLDNACTDGVSISPPASCSNEVCSISASPIVSDCDNAGTDTDPSDDTFTFDLTVTGTNTGSGWTATIDGQSASGTYGTSQTFGPFLISGGDLNFTVTDDLDNACTDGVSISPPASCSNENVCTISATISNIVCDDADTDTDSTDDTYSFELEVSGTNTGLGWETTIDGTTYTGTYNSTQTISGFLINDGDLEFTIIDEVEACSHLQNVVAPSPCSNAIPCSINSTVTNVMCDDAGTNADPSDDTYSLTLTVTGTGVGTGWTANLNGTIVTGNYDIAEAVGPFPIANGSIAFFIFDLNESSCTTSNIVIAPSPCSNNGGPANYCNSAGDFPWHDWISNVEMGGLNKNSGKSQYSDFTNSSADLMAGETQEIKLTADFSWFTYDEHWKVWIDYNQNGIFEEPTEIAFSTLTPSPPNGTNSDLTTGIINVPETALLGSTRMRVTLSRNNNPTPCGNVDFGEVEDYSVNIMAAAPLASIVNNNVQLQAAVKIEKVDLRGITFSETETIERVFVEKSADGLTFKSLFEIQQTNQQLFALEDEAPFTGANFYRAKMQLANGEVAYSTIQKVNFTPILDYAIFPNPASAVVNLNLEKFMGKAAKIVVSNQLGQSVFQEDMDEIRQPIWQLDVANWREGSYFLWVEVEGYQAVTKRLMVMRF